MAKIEMDISEYEAMKENKKLLEDALSREKELSGTIDKLNQEKIEIMEQNKKSVTIIEEKRITEIMYAKIEPQLAMRIICEIADSIRGKGMSSMAFHHNFSPNGVFDYLIEKLFNKTESKDSPPQEKRVVYKGLDEVIQKIEDEIKAEIDLDTHKRLNRLTKLEKASEEITSTNKSLSTEVDILRKANKKLNDKNLESSKKVEEINKDIINYQSKIGSTFSLLKNIEKEVIGMHIFNKSSKIKNISQLITNWENNGSNT